MQKIAIQGTKGSFHHEASELFFKEKEISYLECMSFPEVVRSVRGSDADFGVIAIENALIGTILPNYKLIYNNDLQVVGEIYLPIQLDLLALPGQTKKDIQEVWSHPLAIAQSEVYLDLHHWHVSKKNDTASCAREIYQKDLRGVGVLASPKAAKLYNLVSLEENVQNENDTYTRFFVLSSKRNSLKNTDKVSLSFTLKHESGTLVNLLTKISELKLNLTKIMSVPLNKQQDEYMFYIDVVYENEDNYNNLIAHLQGVATHLKEFGVYKKQDF